MYDNVFVSAVVICLVFLVTLHSPHFQRFYFMYVSILYLPDYTVSSGHNVGQ